MSFPPNQPFHENTHIPQLFNAVVFICLSKTLRSWGAVTSCQHSSRTDHPPTHNLTAGGSEWEYKEFSMVSVAVRASSPMRKVQLRPVGQEALQEPQVQPLNPHRANV